MLKDKKKQEAFIVSLENGFQPLQELKEEEEDIETYWEQTKNMWINNCKEVLGKKKTQCKEWI